MINRILLEIVGQCYKFTGASDKKELGEIVKDTFEEVQVPERLAFFEQNIDYFVDAIYPANILSFQNTSASFLEGELSASYEPIELFLFIKTLYQLLGKCRSCRLNCKI